MVLLFTDPIAARLYIEEFSPKSIIPVEAYLWRSPEPEDTFAGTYNEFVDASDLRPLDIEELTPELIEGDHWTVRVTPAFYVKGYRPTPPTKKRPAGGTGGVLLLSHFNREGEDNLWDNILVLNLSTREAVDRFTGQLTVESDFTFDKDLERLVQ